MLTPGRKLGSLHEITVDLDLAPAGDVGQRSRQLRHREVLSWAGALAGAEGHPSRLLASTVICVCAETAGSWL
jgi:hypothetical protein